MHLELLRNAILQTPTSWNVCNMAAMAQAHDGPPRRPAEVMQMLNEACEKDDPTLMGEAISMASTPGFRFSKSDMVQKGLHGCIGWRAPQVLTYLLEQQGAEVSKVYPKTIFALAKPGTRPLYPFLDVLLAHGWDIDTHGPQRTSWPLLWFATDSMELVDWCLDHGASVYLPGDTPPRDRNGVGEVPRMSLLEKAVGDGTVATFEKLRAKGAPLKQQILHLAVRQAADHALKEGTGDEPSYKQRVAMVRHLIDVVGLDVNAEGGVAGMPSGTPLSLLAQSDNGKDTRDVIWCLLDRGADPDWKRALSQSDPKPQPSPVEVATSARNTRFLDAVQEWRVRQGH